MKPQNKSSRAACSVILIIFALIILSLVITEIVRVETFRREKRTNISRYEDSKNWMKDIPDDTPVSLITIPGTHDSASQNIVPAYFLKCQSSSVKAQLENGFRYLDMRLALYPQRNGETTLHFVHAFGSCKLDARLFQARELLIGHVLADIYLFLANNPSETVIFCVKAENSSDDIAEFSRVLQSHIAKGRQFWYTENRIPTLGEVRGKIVLCSRFTDEEGFGLYLSWSEQNNKEALEDPVEVVELFAGFPRGRSSSYGNVSLYVQDRYKYWPEEKIDAFRQMLIRTGTEFAALNSLCLNFTSTSGGGTLSHPSAYAREINSALLQTEIPEHSGIIIVDFATEEIARHIWSAN